MNAIVLQRRHDPRISLCKILILETGPLRFGTGEVMVTFTRLSLVVTFTKGHIYKLERSVKVIFHHIY